MIARPAYFDAICESARKRWEQLEADAELAGPWHQLFKQVQSPRHVLSELLQNADDAGATEASVRIDEHCFVFSHNGQDFTAENFQSLCRFGYSNKRALHTIGFRGIGFKSTFSLGPSVQLVTPSLSVMFEQARFTLPKWIDRSDGFVMHTEVRVPIIDGQREKEIEKNLQDWLQSPVSLLFFRNIRRLTVGDRKMHWITLGPGSAPNMERMALADHIDDECLLIRSEESAFPVDALEEIKRERLLGTDQEFDFPPCRVEIVSGVKGRLYVVLPTGVETALPFACNAPFIQDPARLKIKEPELSPTNRWLLERVGELAASTMTHWLGDVSLSLADRSRAYDLLPDVDRDAKSLEGVCAATAEEALANAIEGEALLLTNDAELRPSKGCVVLPDVLFDVWSKDKAVAYFDDAGRPALSREVSAGNRRKLLNWGVVDEITRARVLEVLRNRHLPKPNTWRGLLNLWLYIAPDVTGWNMKQQLPDLRVCPIQGADVLYSASEIARLGEKRLLQSDEDWEFLSAHLKVLNTNWLRFLTEQRRYGTEDASLAKSVGTADAMIAGMGLEATSNADDVIEGVAREFFTKQSVSLEDCIRLAQIAAKLGARVGNSFRYVNRAHQFIPAQDCALFDEDGMLEELVPESGRESALLLHEDYHSNFFACSAEDWRQWIASGSARVLEFPRPTTRLLSLWGRRKLEKELQRRGATSEPQYYYVTEQFRIEDCDYDPELWKHWASLAANDPSVWGKVLGRILAQQRTFWAPVLWARAGQVATTGRSQSITSEPLTSSWVLRFRELPCLPDTRGALHKPPDLLRRTRATEPLLDTELFIDKLLDRETVQPLLDALGVRNTPTGPDRLLSILRSLAQSERPPISEVERWYRRLDQMVDHCSTADFAAIKQAFATEKIILTDAGAWTNASGVFLAPQEDDVPGAATIRSSLRDLALWRKVGVADQATAELAIQWLKSLPVGSALSPDEYRRVRALLIRHGSRIWLECGHWLNVARQWVPTDTLRYAITMQSLVAYGHLHDWVKQQTADLQMVAEATQSPPFLDVPRLASSIEERFQQGHLFAGEDHKQPWLSRAGEELSRARFEEAGETDRVRAIAADLANTKWRSTPVLEVIPYIDGTPAGTAKQVEVMWLDRVLYVQPLSKAKLARVVPERLGKAFDRADIAQALSYCYGRSPDDVTEYIEENFDLAPRSTAADVVESRAEPPTTPPAGTGAKVDSQTLGTQLLPPSPHGNGSNDESDPTDTQPTDDSAVEPVEGKAAPPKERRPVRPKQSVLERFALSQGFQKDGDDRFFHTDGSWIAKTRDNVFPWEWRTRTGDLVRLLWPKDHCLEREPLEIEAEMWTLIDKSPETHSLILSDDQGSPCEFRGTQLRALRASGGIALYPAAYRLVHRSDSGLEMRTA